MPALQLSPLNSQTIRARAMAYADDQHTPRGGSRKPREVVMWECPYCLEHHDNETDAEKCCEIPQEEKDAAPYCPVCGDEYVDHLGLPAA